jgi:hypothetical protein
LLLLGRGGGGGRRGRKRGRTRKGRGRGRRRRGGNRGRSERDDVLGVEPRVAPLRLAQRVRQDVARRQRASDREHDRGRELRAAVRPRRAGAVDGDEVRQGRAVGGVGAEADKVEVGGGDARDGEDRLSGEGLGAGEAGEGRGREGGQVERRERGGPAAAAAAAAPLELVVRVEVFLVLGEGRAALAPFLSLRSSAAATEPAAARKDAAPAAGCPAAAEKLARAAVPGAGCFNIFVFLIKRRKK